MFSHALFLSSQYSHLMRGSIWNFLLGNFLELIEQIIGKETHAVKEDAKLEFLKLKSYAQFTGL